MQKLTKLILALSLCVPLFSYAAYNDVSLTTDAVISSGGVTINVSGTTASVENIVVDTSSFTIQMQPSSYVKMSVPAFNQLTYSDTDNGNDNINYTCDSTHSILEITRTGNATSTITVTPSSTICSSANPNSAGNGAPVSSGGGGGGGGGSYIYVPPVTASSTSNQSASAVLALQNQIAALQAQLGNSSGGGGVARALITIALKRGMTNPAVKVLQQLLNTDPDTRVAVSGAGSPGKETTLFGMLTETAVKKFQAKYGIATSGTPATTGYGRVGPKTRAKLNALLMAK